MNNKMLWPIETKEALDMILDGKENIYVKKNNSNIYTPLKTTDVGLSKEMNTYIDNFDFFIEKDTDGIKKMLDFSFESLKKIIIDNWEEIKQMESEYND